MLYLSYSPPPIPSRTATYFPDTPLCRSPAAAHLVRRRLRCSTAPLGPRGNALGPTLDVRPRGNPRPRRHRGGRAPGAPLRHRARCLTVLGVRSEEHTSELQSLMRTSYAVFCLKKKKIHIYH